MPDHQALGATRLGAPARTVLPELPLGIEAKTGNDHEDMSLADVYCDPLAMSPLAVPEEALGGHLVCHQPGIPQDIRNRSRAIVAIVVDPGMAAAPLVGKSLNVVGGSNGSLHGRRSLAWRDCATIDDHCVVRVRLVGDGVLGLHLARTGGGTNRPNEGEHREESSHRFIT